MAKRWLKRLGIAFVSVLLALVAAVVFLTGTHIGRDILLSRALPALNGSIPGRVEVESLSRLSVSGLGLRGVRIIDPQQQEVARLSRLDVDIELSALLHERIIAPRVELSAGWVDLRQLSEPRQGLVAAFVDPDAAPSPPSEGPAPYVLVRSIVFRDIDLSAPDVKPIGALEVRELSLDGQFELDVTPRAHVSQLTLKLERAGKPFGEIRQLSAALARGVEPSSVHVAAALLGIDLEASVEAVAPTAPTWQQQPLEVSLQLEGVSAAALSGVLNNPELEGAFEGALALSADAEGSAESLVVDATVESAGGRLELESTIEEMKRFSVNIETEQFSPEAVRKGTLEHAVTLRLAATADATDPASVPVTLAVERSALDSTALPELNLEAVVTPVALQQIALKLEDGPSRAELSGSVDLGAAAASTKADVHLDLDVRGETLEKWARFSGQKVNARAHLRAQLDVGLDGAESVAVRGSLSGRQLKVSQAEIERVDARVNLSGKPTRPKGSIDLSVQRARFGDERLSQLELKVDGGPQQYRVQLAGDAAKLTAKSELEVSPADDRVSLHGRAHGTLAGRVWSVNVEPTTVGFDGRVETEGLVAALGEQRLRVAGRIDGKRGEIDFSFSRIALDELSSMLELAEPLRGSASLAGQVRGSLDEPTVELRATGKDLTLGQRPPIDVTVATKLDAAGGLLALQLELAASQTQQSQSPLALKLDLEHRFDGSGAWQSALPNGTLDGILHLKRIDSRFVADWLELRDLPAHGVVTGKIAAQGSRKDPKIFAELQTQASVSLAALNVATNVSLDRGQLRVSSSADDQGGRWLQLDAGIDLDADQIEQQLAAFSKAAAERGWFIELDVRERGVEALPGAKLAELQGMAVGATLVLKHEAHQEPRGELSISARQTGPIAAYETNRCAFSRTRVDFEAALERGELRGLLTAKAGRKALLNSKVVVPVKIMPAVRGEGFELGAISASLQARRLELQSLPLLCGIVRGTLTANVEVDAPLGSQPRVDATLSAIDFSFGSQQTVGIDAEAHLNHRAARVSAGVVAEGKRSTLNAQLPVDLREGHLTVQQDAALSAKLVLRDLPISPFLNPSGAVSHASGTVAGSVVASGPINKPQVAGQVQLKDIAFTATSLAQPLRGVNGTLRFSNDRLEVDGFEAHDKGGTLQLEGQANFDDPENIEAKLSIVTDEFPIRQQGQVVATVDLEAGVAMAFKDDGTRVSIDLGSMDMWLESLDFRSGIALAQHPDFVVDGVAPPQPNAPEEPEPMASGAAFNEAPGGTATAAPHSTAEQSDAERATRLILAAEDGVWIKRSDFAVNARADLTTEITDNESRVRGRVEIMHGYAQIMGKVFDIDKGGYLEFVGTKRPDPAVNVTVVHDNRRSGQRITLTIAGRSSAPELTFRVDDRVVTAGKAFEALYGSQQTNESPNAAQDQAKGFVGGLTAGLMATTARRELGAAAPIIVIEPGQQSDEGRVRAGFDFDFLVPAFLRDVVTGVYFEGIADKSSEEASGGPRDNRVHAAALLELYFPKNFFTAGQYGPGSTWSADIGWQL